MREIDDFREFIYSWKDLYSWALITCLAIKANDGPKIFQAQILFMPSFPKINQEFKIETDHVLALTRIEKADWEYILSCLEAANDGYIYTPEGKIFLEKDTCKRLDAQFNPIHPPRIEDGPRLPALQIFGTDRFTLKKGGLSDQLLDWELKAAPEPYDNFNDLLTYMGFPEARLLGDRTELSIIGLAPAVLSQDSRISEGKAIIYKHGKPHRKGKDIIRI